MSLRYVECPSCHGLSHIGQWCVRDRKPNWICPRCKQPVERPISEARVDDDDGLASHTPDEFDLAVVDCWDGGGDDTKKR